MKDRYLVGEGEMLYNLFEVKYFFYSCHVILFELFKLT